MLNRTTLLFVAVATAVAQRQPPPRLVTSDVVNFWTAYDAGRIGQRQDAFRKLYFEAGTPALQEFLNQRVGSPQSLESLVDDRFPAFFATARPYMLQVDQQRDAILGYLARFREIFPAADFPTVTFVVGPLTTKEMIGRNGVVIDVAAFSRGAGVDVTEVARKPLTTAAPPERLPLMVVHELVHTQSVADEGAAVPGLLVDLVREGAADFVTELVTRIDPNSHTDAWAKSRRADLFQDLARNLSVNEDLEESGDPWHPAGFGLMGSPTRMVYSLPSAGDDPFTLGNWIGKQICASYYQRAADKSSAIASIVTLKDIAAIVRGSDYSWLLPPKK